MHKNFLIYVTANDDPNYLIDYLNFYQMARLEAGVKEIQLFLVISAVEPFSIKDQKIIGELIKIVEQSSQITVKKILFKPKLSDSIIDKA